MSFKSLVRRTAAVTAATTLISTGGGALASAAYAAPLPTATIATVAPSSWDNRSTVTVTVTATNLFPQDSIVFTPACAISGPPDANGLCGSALAGTEVGPFSVAANNPSAPNPTTLQQTETASVPLATAPPGYYRITVVHVDGGESSPWSKNGVVQYFKIFAYGGANAQSSTVGADGSGVDPFGVDCSFVDDCGRGDKALDIVGSNIAIGAKLEFLNPSDGSVNDKFTFTPGNHNNGANSVGTEDGTGNQFQGTAYPSGTLLQGNYTYPVDAVDGVTPGFTPGWFNLRITNTDGNTSGATARFAQPWFASSGSLSPTQLGQGATQATVTITGQGIRAGSSLFVDGSSCNSAGDTSVGPSTVSGLAPDGTYTKISAPVSLTSCATKTARGVGIVGPDGGKFYRSGLLQVVALPTITAISPDATAYAHLGQGAHVGFADGTDAPSGITITGGGFEDLNPQGHSDPNLMTHFSAAGVTFTTRAIVSPTTAVVSIDVDPAAAVERKDVTVTNPDGGSSTAKQPTINGQPDPTKATLPFSVNAGPKIATVTPSSFAKTQTFTPVVVKGSGFENGSINDSSISISPPDGFSISSTTSPDASTVDFVASTSNAATGPRALTIENPNDFGRATCACLGVDTLQVVKVNGNPVANPAPAPNSGPATLTFQADPLVNGGPSPDAVTSASTVTLSRSVPLAGQGDIVGTSLAPGTTAKQASATFDLTNVAPGAYNAKLVLDPTAATPTIWTCTGCVSVTSPGPVTISSVAPANGGQGATNRILTFTGTNIFKGVSVTIDNVTVNSATFVSNTSFTASISIAPDAKTGTSNVVTVTSGDGSKDATKTFAIDAAPAPTTSSPAALGTGAGLPASGENPAPAVTVTGTQGTFDSTDGAALSYGPGTAVTGVKVTTGTAPIAGICPPTATDGCMDSATGNIVIQQSAPVGPADLTFTNGDGGVATLAKALTINPGPKVQSVTNETGASILPPDGTEHTITILGAGFSTDTNNKPIVMIGGTALDTSKVTVNSATKITALVTEPTTATRGVVTVGVTNPGDKGYGDCTVTVGACPVVGSLPGVPTSLVLTPLAQAIRATWGAPTSDGGSPITGYHLKIVRSSIIVQELTVPASPRSYTFTGLTNGATYTVSVYAVNAAVSTGHTGPVATASAIAGLHPTLTIAQSAKSITYGARETLSGRLLYGSTPLAGRTIVFSAPINGHFLVTTTSSTGAWALSFIPTYSFTGHATSLQDSTYAPANSVNITTYVMSRVTWKAPPNKSSSSSSTTLTLSGVVAPSKAGKVVYLYRFIGTSRVLVAKMTLNKYSQFVLSFKPARGTYVFRVYVPALTGNAAAWSIPLTLYRT